VQLRQYSIGDAIRVAAFGVKCMNAVNFSIAYNDPLSGLTTVLAPIPQCQNLRPSIDPTTLACDFSVVRNNSPLVPAGTPLVRDEARNWLLAGGVVVDWQLRAPPRQ
jgi:hypothetical protein